MAGPRTHDPWIASPTPYRLATVPPQSFRLSLFLLLTTQHTIDYVTHLLPARSLQYIEDEL